MGCRGPASAWELRPEPRGGACQAHSWPGSWTPDWLQATTSGRENLTLHQHLMGPSMDKDACCQKKDFNKVPSSLPEMS